jgi:hypothetical protein
MSTYVPLRFFTVFMGCCNLGAMISQLQELMYAFEFIGTNEYVIDGVFGDIPTIMLVDNQAMVQMSKNYHLTLKN